MGLNITTETVHRVDYSDLDKFVNETYGFKGEPISPNPALSHHVQFPYSFTAVEESGNDVSHEFNIDGYVDDWSEGNLKTWIESGGKTWISNHTILDDLCRKGLIPAGDYVVRVSW